VKEEEEFKAEENKRRNKEDYRKKWVRKVAKERNIKPWTSGRRCENWRGRILVLYVGTTTSLKIEKFALFVVNEYRK
jgi:hypothetical protein